MRGWIRLTGSEYGAEITVRPEDIITIRDVGKTKEQNLGDTKTILGLCSGSAIFVTESANTVLQLIEKDEEGTTAKPVAALRRA